MQWKNLLCPDRIRTYSGRVTTSDLRTEFEKDYHRIIGSASFRRLQDKTQVFPLDRSDFVRTRLTHSLEVSSLAKSLGQNISENIIQNAKDADFGLEQKAAICDVLQCAGLLHDIGNPPFGHFGETVIQQWFKHNLPQMTYREQRLTELLDQQMIEDFYHFEGNTQALRLVTKLHFLVDEHGMNLTKGLLSTIIKYPVSSLEINEKSGNIKDKKMGYFYADKEIFESLQVDTQTYGKRHPLTFILEAADDIAYKTADIEDAFKKGCISYDILVKELKSEAALNGCRDNDEKKYYLSMIEKLEKKYFSALAKNYREPELYAVQNWIVAVQGFLITCATFGFTSNYMAIMNGQYPADLFAGTFAQNLMRMLGNIAYQYAFLSAPIIKLEIAAQSLLNFLLDKFVDAVLYFDSGQELDAVQEKLISLISDNYKNTYYFYSKGKTEAQKLYLRLLLITDFICGMTDSYAKQLYRELNGID